MSKTPEEMADEYTKCWWPDFNDIKTCSWTHAATRLSFLAGYQAARDEDKAKMQELKANWQFCCEDKARALKELASVERAKDQLADKVMNSPKNSNGWISVKERLPNELIRVLTYGCNNYSMSFIKDGSWVWFDDHGHIFFEREISHWMPLPEAPKEEG